MYPVDANSLKVGFLFLNGRAAGWQIESVRDLAARPGFEISLLDCRVSVVPRRRLSLLRHLTARLTRIAIAVESRILRRALRSSPQLLKYSEMHDLAQLEMGYVITAVDCRFGADGSVLLGATELDKVRTLSLDVLIAFSDLPCPDALRRLPRFGAWSFHYSDGQSVRRELTIGFWEVYFKIRRTMVALERISIQPLDRWVIRRGWYPTEVSSWTLNQLCTMEYARALLIDALDLLRRSGTLPQAELDNLDSAEQPLSRRPNALHFWIGLVKLSARRAWARLLHLLFWEQWYLLAGHCQRISDVAPADLRPVYPPAQTWWADPFLFHHAGKFWVFAEEKARQDAPASICVFEWTAEGVKRVGTALSPGYHVSYPFIFEHKGNVFLLPETSSNGTVEIWECVDFPLRWRRRRVIMEGLRAADSTLLQHGGRWWLFATISRSEALPNLCVELFVFSSDDPIDGEWVAHPANPVVTDCRRARMAGPFIRVAENGQLLRIGQSNSRMYGESIAVCRVDILSPTEYRESLVRVFEPDWDPRVIGIHHMSTDGERVVMDAKKRVLRSWS